MDEKTPHPIAHRALTFIDPGPGGKGWVFREHGREQLVLALEKLFGEARELRHAVTSLVSLAKHYDDRGFRSVADALIEIAATATDALRSFGQTEVKLAEELESMTTQVFSAFTATATEAAHQAPKVTSAKYGRVARPGTISASALGAMARRRA